MLFVNKKSGDGRYRVFDTSKLSKFGLDMTNPEIVRRHTPETWYTEKELRLLLKQGIFVYGVLREKTGDLRVTIYPDVQTILDKYQLRETAMGKTYWKFKLDNQFQHSNPRNGMIEVLEYCGSSKRVVMPDFVDVVGVYCFNKSTLEVETLKLSQSVLRLKSNSLWNVNLGSIDLPRSLQTIEANVFSNSSLLKRVEIPAGVTYVGAHAFHTANGALEEVVVNANCILDAGAFRDAPNLKSVIINGNCTLKDSCFDGCTGLETLKLTGNFQLDSYVFANCEKLKSVELNGDFSIGTECFSGCESLEEIKLNGVINGLGHQAFSFSPCLRSLVFPKGLVKVNPGALKYCKSSVIFLPAGVEINGALSFAGCLKLKVLTIGGITFNGAELKERHIELGNNRGDDTLLKRIIVLDKKNIIPICGLSPDTFVYVWKSAYNYPNLERIRKNLVVQYRDIVERRIKNAINNPNELRDVQDEYRSSMSRQLRLLLGEYDIPETQLRYLDDYSAEEIKRLCEDETLDNDQLSFS